MGKLLSLVLSAAYLVAGLASEDTEVVLPVLGFVLFSLACIWFGDEIGGYTGWIGLRPITARTPGGMIRFAGWLLLLLPAVAFGIQHLRG
jgi:hypothetical protein